MKQDSYMWGWIVGGIVIIVLGLWWLAANKVVMIPIFSDMVAPAATTTPSTANSNTGASVSNTVDRKGTDVLTIAKNIQGASTFASWLDSTGASAQIKGKGPYTIFVPTDGSIGQLTPGTFSNLSAAGKKRFVLYHVISGRAVDVKAQTAGTLGAMSGDMLNFSFGNQKLPMINSSIVVTQYNGSNGVVYLIDNPLIPPKK